MTEHAILSASSSKRWMECPPSAKLEQGFPKETSSYASEGIFAHSLGELKLARAVTNNSKPGSFKKKLALLQSDPRYDPELEENVEVYVTQVMERYLTAVNTCKDTLALLEQRLDFSRWVPGGFGTGDMVIISDDCVEVIDLKYGKGVPVFAKNNPQTRLYGLGAIATYETLYNFSKVKMTIIQPRLDSISTEELAIEELIAWGEEYVKPKADLAIAGKGEYSAGEHCRFCRARFICRARAEKSLELAKYDFQKPSLLAIKEIAKILSRAGELQKWTRDIQDYALTQAENHGVTFPGWKLVEGKSNRKYTDKDAVAKTLLENGFEKSKIYEPEEILGITAMTKRLGKKLFDTLLSPFIVKPPGKPTLVPKSDKRSEIKKDFAQQ